MWAEGFAACRLLGGDLVSIHSQAEDDSITAVVASLLSVTAATGYIWIGLYRDPVTGQFKWTDESAVDYTNFVNDDIRMPYKCTYLNAYGGDTDTEKYGKWDIMPNVRVLFLRRIASFHAAIVILGAAEVMRSANWSLILRRRHHLVSVHQDGFITG